MNADELCTCSARRAGVLEDLRAIKKVDKATSLRAEVRPSHNSYGRGEQLWPGFGAVSAAAVAGTQYRACAFTAGPPGCYFRWVKILIQRHAEQSSNPPVSLHIVRSAAVQRVEG